MPAEPSNRLLTDRLLRSWLRCRRRAWLDRYGDPGQRLWNAHRALQLDDQQRCFVSLLERRPQAGAAACAAGAPAVVGVRLRGSGPAGLALEGHPPLLRRTSGESRWGAYAYQPVMARQGRRLTREHRLVMGLWGQLLAGWQQGPVSHGLVVAAGSGRLERERLALGEGLQRQLQEALPKLAADLERPQPPPLVSDRKKCVLCSWRGVCDREAALQGHLSEVSGIGAKRRELLIELGLPQLSALAGADPEALADALEVHGEQHREVAARLVAQARVQQRGEPLRLPVEPAQAAMALPELRTAAGVLVYDIESDPDARDDFLHGFLRIERGADGRWPDWQTADIGSYRPLLALHEHGEARLWRRLRRLLAATPADWPVLHYGETESIALVRLAQRQGASERELAALRRRLVDLHQRLRRHWLLPVNSYGLKAVAGWLGFAWSQKGVDGARCLLWWRQWRGDGTPAGRGSLHGLRRIFRYNHDDGRATWAVASWLLAQDAALPAPTGGATTPVGTETSRVIPSPVTSWGSARA
jgi:predicted RecB family nuclease